MARTIRFGVVTPFTTSVAAWRDEVRRVADLGYSTVLVPDVPEWHLAPTPMLAIASAMVDISVGTWVYASPVRPAFTTAWEAHTLSVLTEGRFEFGIGTGRPNIESQLRDLGLPVGSGDRVDQVRATVAELRRLDGPNLRTPVVMAVRGPKAQALAAEVADTVTFSVRPDESGADVARIVSGFTSTRDVELALHVNVVGDVPAPFMGPPDTDPARLRAIQSLSVLPADPAAAIDEIHGRREELGFTYFVIGSNSAATLAPVVAALAGS